ncbi:MAG: F0F1 ATP synthase subunit delta [Desertifilum sp. SIO1I2]|nr:F0F1 ATP synthase subunit delta [Desertifilum sp. SIO1I2]
MKGSGTLVGAIVEPYAEALMSLGQANDLVEKFGEDARFLKELLASSEELRQFVENPIANPEAKKAVLRQIAGEQIHSYTLNFLSLLVDRRRIQFLDAIAQQYLALLRKLNKTVLAEVTSVVELSDEQKQVIRDRVIAMTQAQQVELETTLDPSLIGGVIIKVGSQVIDASLRGQLRRIGIRLTSAT